MTDNVRGREQKQYPLTVTGTGWTTVRAIGIPYQTQDGAWRLKGNVCGTTPSGSIIALTFSNLTFKAILGGAQSGYSAGNQAAYFYVNVGQGSSIITIVAGASCTLWQLGFDVELESKPSFMV